MVLQRSRQAPPHSKTVSTQNYWRPLQINREFASHFRKPNAWIRLFRDIRTDRAADLGTRARIGCHTFRATGITAYLEARGTLENAQAMADHASPRTTQLYDRTGDEITLDERSNGLRFDGIRRTETSAATKNGISFPVWSGGGTTRP
jgi:integrase